MTPQNNENCCTKCSVEEILKNTPKENILEKNATLLKSLADPTRLKIVYLLKNGELCACEILEALDKSQSTISHHLNMMKKENILITRKEGTWIHYRLANENIIEILENLFNIVED